MILHLYRVKDGQDEVHEVVAQELCDSVFITAKKKDGQLAHFEAELRHLGQWGDENGFSVWRRTVDLQTEAVFAIQTQEAISVAPVRKTK